MSRKLKIILLCIILLVGILFRFTALGSIPSSPDWDEAALGYNAYSLLQTGHDEYGTFIPVVLRSFDDYKPALYAYVDIPFIKVFGLNTFAIRLPSAILGIFAIWGTYLLVKELFREDKKIGKYLVSDLLALCSAFFLAISPWHIQFSRVAFETNLGLTFIIFGTVFFLKSFMKSFYLFFSTILFAISIYAYQSEKVFIPLLVLLLIATMRRQFFLLPKKYLIFSGVIGFLIVLPMFMFIITNPNSLSRASGVSVFNNPNPTIERMNKRVTEDRQKNDFVGMVVDNKRVAYIPIVIGNYLSHFDLNWLFITGDKTKRHQPPDMGHLYIFDLLFLLVGLYTFIFAEYSSKTKTVILGWILLTPVASSITWDVPNAVRTITFLPMIQVLIALGFISLLYKAFLLRAKKGLFFKLILGIYGIGMLINIAYYCNQYFVQYNFFNSQDWQYGYQDTISYVETIQSSYNKIIVSDERPMDQSYIFFLYYLKFSPEAYQQSSLKTHEFAKYEFHAIDYNKKHDDTTLFIGRPNDFPDSAHVIKTIYYLDGTPAMKIVKG